MSVVRAAGGGVVQDGEVVLVHRPKYDDSRSRPKRVRWWRRHAVSDDGFAPNDEVDNLLWAAPEAASRLLTHDRDRVLLEVL